ncbi:MAG: PilZ domain-containing protein [Candidatus Krumholzibacteriia bacterium]
MAALNVDRRRAQRVDARMKLTVQVPRPDGSLAQASLETLNISSSGLYFQTDHFIEPMTKLDLLLELPVAGATPGAPTHTTAVRCEGIVVRSVPEAPDPSVASYEVAVFFTHFESEALGRLEDHIALLLTDA